MPAGRPCGRADPRSTFGGTCKGLRRIRPCTAEETAELADYLARSSVPGYADLLRSGRAFGSIGEVDGREQLGALWSIFGNLGGIEAWRTVSREKYLIREAREVWDRVATDDRRGHRTLQGIIAAERAGMLTDRRVTVALTVAGPLVVDGNKRLIAIYETSPVDVVVPVSVIESAPSRPPFAVP